MGWTQPKEADALRPPTDWQLHVGIPMTARKELAAVLFLRAHSLQGTIYPSPYKNWIPRYSQMITGKQEREIKQGKDFKVA